MGIRSIFLITDSLYNCDCGWSAVPKKHACALSFQLLLASVVTALTVARLALCIRSSTRVRHARIHITVHLAWAYGTIYVKEKPTSNQQTKKPAKTKFLNISSLTVHPIRLMLLTSVIQELTRHLIKNLQPKLTLQYTILLYI